MHSASGSSCAKIILIGEHAVVYGQPAIALPVKAIKLTATIIVNPRKQQMIDSKFYQGPLQAAAATDFAGIADLIAALLAYFHAEQAGFTLRIVSALPPERGMGSSAATATAVVRAFYAAFDTALTQRTLLQWTARSEKAIHGNPSGLDAATTSADTPLWFTKTTPIVPIVFPTNGSLVIADTGIMGQTKEAVQAVATRRAQDPATVDAQIKAIGQAVALAKAALLADDLPALGAQLTKAQVQLRALGVSNAQLDHLIQAAMAAGALGAKLTGSGLGGCMIALADSAAQAQQIRLALQAAGAAATWQYDFSTGGH
ncbi:mevalonate kinase [Lacticaseibacillus jixiensis]|uniref:mevalonate kinase n=1 Tax=Lacticaseibacillus jixiensis TaxID=3231926 RepID=UPI0036F36955